MLKQIAYIIYITCEIKYVQYTIKFKMVYFSNKQLHYSQAPSPGDNSVRTVVESKRYLQAVLYDHITRRKT